MRFIEGRRLLLEAMTGAEPEATEIISERDAVHAVISLAARGRVKLKLELSLQYGRKRGHVHLSQSMFLWSPDLETLPADAAFLEQPVPMPEAMKRSVVAFRRRMNGRVPWTPPPISDLFSASVLVDGWTVDDFLERLVHVFGVAQAARHSMPPLRSAGDLLAWQQARAEKAGPLFATMVDKWCVRRPAR